LLAAFTVAVFGRLYGFCSGIGLEGCRGTEKLEEEMQRDRPSMNFNSNPIKVDSQFQFSMRGKELL